MANLETLELTINANAQSATEGLKSLINSLSSLNQKVSEVFGNMKALNNEIQRLGANGKIVMPSVSGRSGASSATRKAKSAIQKTIPATDVFGNKIPYGATIVGEDGKKSKVATEDMVKKFMATGEMPTAVKETKELGKAAEGASKKQKTLWQALKETGNKLKDTLPKFHALHRVLKMASTMMLRMALRAFFKGAVEGYKNYYEYAKATGNALAGDIDKINNSWQQIKNQMGASLATVFSAVIPILNTLANAAITAFNSISQLLALLSGKGSWSRATEVNQSLNETANSASGASQKVKELLANFDELNVIASESGGGGGGGSGAANAVEMFEEVTEFDSKIRALVDFLKDNMESIKGIAIAIGTAILAWKLADAFAGTLPLLSKIAGFAATGAVIAITLQVTWMLTNQYLDTGEVGWLIADVFTTAIGATAAWGVAKHFIGGNAGAYAAAITLTFSAFTGIKALIDNTDVGALSKESILTSIENALKVGAAGAILFKMVGGATLGTSLAGGGILAVTAFAAFIGLKTALDPNVELFSLQSITTSILSAAAVGLGVAILAGNPVIGAGAAILTFLAYIAIKASVRSSDVSWGTIDLTDEQVQEFVKSKMFKIDVTTSIERINTTIEHTAVDKSKLETAISTLIGDMNIIKLGIADEQDYAQMRSDVDHICETVDSYIADAKATGKLTLQFTPTLVGEDDEERGEWYENYVAGWDKINDYVELKGKEIGKLLVKAEKDGLTEDESVLLGALMDQLSNVTRAMSEAQINSEAFAALRVSLGDLTQASAGDVVNAFSTYKDQLTTEYTKLVEEQYALQGQLVAALFAIDPESQEYKNALAAYEEMGRNLPKAVQDGVDSATEPGRNVILDWIYGRHENGEITGYNTALYKVEDILKSAGLTPEGIKSQLHSILVSNGFTAEEIKAMDLINFTGFDLLSAELQEQIVSWIKVTPETISLLKEGLGLNIDQIISFSNFDEMTDDTRNDFINALTEAFGSDATVEALKKRAADTGKEAVDAFCGAAGGGGGQNQAAEAGKNITTAYSKEIKPPAQSVFDGINNKFKTAYTTWKKTVGNHLPTANPYLQSTFGAKRDSITKSYNNAYKAFKAKIGQKLPTANPSLQSNFSTKKNAVANSYNNAYKTFKSKIGQKLQTANISIPSGYGSYAYDATWNVRNNIANTLGGYLQLAQVSTPWNFGGDALNAVQNVYNSARNKVAEKLMMTVGLRTDGSKVSTSIRPQWNGSILIEPHAILAARGGMIDNGQLFIAQEAGPELVGTIGNQTGVANQQQIVDGIRKGVADANSEQNGLLRQQNNLLRAILEKESSVRLNASAALGRVAKQSIDMYGSMVGG